MDKEYLGMICGEDIYFDPLNWENTLYVLQALTGLHWKTMTESTGLRKRVFYNPCKFVEKTYNGITYLQFIPDSDNNIVELPLNCSSCYSMFAEKDLFHFDFSYVDTSKVVDMTAMFAKSVLPNGLQINMENVENASCMFIGCRIPSSMKLISMCKLKDATEMFAESILPNDFSLNITKPIKCTCDMFRGCDIPEDIIASWLNTEKFDVNIYLKKYLDILPEASVAACVTKEDCDALLSRLGLYDGDDIRKFVNDKYSSEIL